jgi:hypothetical protein
MSPAERVAIVRREMRHRTERGEAHAASAVMMLAGKLPQRAHRWFARTVYSNRFFNTIVSYMPAARGHRWLAGARVRSFTPVLPLTRGVPLTVGIIVADDSAGLGSLSPSAPPRPSAQRACCSTGPPTRRRRASRCGPGCCWT